jgi:hypothetical protein
MIPAEIIFPTRIQVAPTAWAFVVCYQFKLKTGDWQIVFRTLLSLKRPDPSAQHPQRRDAN